jgi:hypothetical protein
MWLRLALLLGILAAACAPAQAHTRSQSVSTWTVDGATVQGIFQVDAYRTTQLSDEPQNLNTLLKRHLADTVTLMQDGKPCKALPTRTLASSRGDLREELRFACPRNLADSPATLVMGAFFDVSISHVHYIRVVFAGGAVDERVLTQGAHTLTVGAEPAAHPNSFASFVTLGFEHVLSGADHLAFLLALMLLAGSVRRILIAVTGFTLGHSVTLALVAFGVLKPDTAAIEALIGFTVAWAAGDALARHRNLPRWYGLVGAAGIVLLPLIGMILGLPVMAFSVLAGLSLFAATMSYARGLDTSRIAPAIATVFGLAHGAGFAGPLLEMQIMPGDLVWTLLAFNIGVEFGQLAAIAILAGLWWLVGRSGRKLPAAAFDVTASMLFALGTFWFIARALA